MQYEEIIHTFMAKMGLETSNIDQDSLTLLFDDNYEVTFYANPDDHSVIFSCEIINDQYLKPEAAKTLLELSLLGAKTDGAAFSLHRELGAIVLWKRFNNFFENVAEFENAVNKFIAQIILWEEKLPEIIANDDLKPTDNNYNLSSSNLKV